MRAVLQRVSRAEVRVEGRCVGAIAEGCVALIGVARGDTEADGETIAKKICGLRLWSDEQGKMNLPLGGRAVLAISQFTLLADTRRGMRPSFDAAAPATEAAPLFAFVVEQLRAMGVTVATGVFQAEMQVELVNEGPVTVIVESSR